MSAGFVHPRFVTLSWLKPKPVRGAEARSHLIETAPDRLKQAVAEERDHIRARQAEAEKIGQHLRERVRGEGPARRACVAIAKGLTFK